MMEEEEDGGPKGKEEGEEEAGPAGVFPTAVAEAALEASRQKSLRRIFGTAETLRHVRSPENVGTYHGLLQKAAQEHCQEGSRCFSRGEWERAITCFTKALHLDPHKGELYEQKAEAFLQLCDFRSAAMHLRKAHSVSSSRKESVRARLAFVSQLQGQCLYEQSCYLEALECFTCAAELEPRNKLFRMRSIACLAAMKRFNDCLQMVNEEVAQEKNPDLFVLRARLYEHFGKVKEAICGLRRESERSFQVTLCFHNLREALALAPEHAEARVMMSHLKKEAQRSRDQAVAKAVKGNLKAALLKINRAIDYNPAEASCFLFRGSTLRRLKDFDAAIDDYLQAVSLSQEAEEEEGAEEVRAEAQKQVLLTYNDFAVHCYAKGCYGEAVLLLNKAIKGEKSEKGLYMNRGDCFLQLGELNFAMADYQQALELRPRDPLLWRRVAWLHNEMGLREFRERRYLQAEACFSQAITNNPREAKYYLHRAKSRMFLQEAMGAKEDLVTALLLDPARAETHALARNFFPGEQIHASANSKMGALARALLERRMAACPAPAPPAKHKGEKDPPKDVYIENEGPEKVAEEEEKAAAEKRKEKLRGLEVKRLKERAAACQAKAHQAGRELKGVLQARASLDPVALRLDPYPRLPAKEPSDKPYQWRNFHQGIGHF